MITPTQTQWPTPTGEPVQEHDVIGLCRLLESAPMGIGHRALSKVIRSQHALIVQMREALNVASRQPLVPPVRMVTEPALTAANDYLKGQQ